MNVAFLIPYRAARRRLEAGGALHFSLPEPLLHHAQEDETFWGSDRLLRPREIVFVVTASVQNANRDAVWSGFRVRCVELIDPNALSATIDAQFTQSLGLYAF